MDPITELFQTMNIVGVVHARLEATAPWGFKRDANFAEGTTKSPPETTRSPRQFAHFGMVSRGNCWLSIEGVPDALPLAGGDCFLLAPGSSYILRDSPRTRPRSFCEIAPKQASQVIHYGSGGAPTTIVSGWFRFDPNERQASEAAASLAHPGEGRSSTKPGAEHDSQSACI